MGTSLFRDSSGKSADCCAPCQKGSCFVGVTSQELRTATEARQACLIEVACAADIHFVVDDNNPSITVDTTCQFQAAGTRTWVLPKGATHFRSTANATVSVFK